VQPSDLGAPSEGERAEQRCEPARGATVTKRGHLVRLVGAPLARATSADEVADAIVVLGAPLRPDGGLTPIVEERVRAGVELWYQGRAGWLCMTGGLTVCSTVTEGDGMAAAAVALGVPRPQLLIERMSRNTIENARNTARVLLPRGLRRVWLVTQPFHLRRAAFWFRRAGLEPLGWYIRDSIQFADPWRGLRWVLREYGALAMARLTAGRPDRTPG
jgi:uncharacterized SAM-binding protein YcdF (DUF218 family)